MSQFFPVIPLPTQEVYVPTLQRRGGHELGTLGQTEDGRVFRYMKNGAAQIAAARLCQAPAAVNARAVVVSGLYAANIGDKLIQVTSAAVVANQFQDGWLTIEDQTGAGYLYPITANSATDAPAAGDVLVTLGVGLRVALSATSTVGMYSPFNGVVIHPSPATTKPTGVTNAIVPAAYFFWGQIRGLAAVLAQGTPVINKGVIDSATIDGAIAPAAIAAVTDINQNQIGIVATVPGTPDGKTCTIDLAIG